MTNGMKWFGVVSIAVFFLMMVTFAMVLSQSPGIPNPTQQKVDAYTKCLQRSPGFFGPSDLSINNCKEITGQE